MPLKKLKSVFKSITKPFKKVLRSPIGKVAGLAALYYGMPALGRTSMFKPDSFMGTLGKSGWQKALWGLPESSGIMPQDPRYVKGYL